MVHHLFPKLLDDSGEYGKAQAHWERMIDQASIDAGQSDMWRPSMVSHYEDGTPLPRDANPIFEARSSTLNRALRIVQRAPTSGEPEIIAYLDRVGMEGSGDTPAPDELVLVLELSDETSAIAERLLRLWMSPGTTRGAMSDIIAEVAAPE